MLINVEAKKFVMDCSIVPLNAKVVRTDCGPVVNQLIKIAVASKDTING